MVLDSNQQQQNQPNQTTCKSIQTNLPNPGYPLPRTTANVPTMEQTSTTVMVFNDASTVVTGAATTLTHPSNKPTIKNG
jgi:hypothetical protein